MTQTATQQKDYDAITRLARDLEPRVENRIVLGLAWQSPHAEAFWGNRYTDFHPFTGMRSAGKYRIFRLPQTSRPERLQAIRVLKQLGAAALIWVGTGYALHRRFEKGTLTSVCDHIHLTGGNPLTGPNDARIGPRYPDMTQPYDPAWTKRMERAALALGYPIQRCVYAEVSGPPTPAECRLLAFSGADVYGDGLTADVMTAAHCGLPIAAVIAIRAVYAPEEIPDTCNENETNDTDRRLSELISRIVV
ncbi:MAG: hypothetical protein FJY97_18730 [candidate division Zixibacteria bacterium]|nr:hypothetical protein [candidate division Zixibacteria bacterium]